MTHSVFEQNNPSTHQNTFSVTKIAKETSPQVTCVSYLGHLGKVTAGLDAS